MPGFIHHRTSVACSEAPSQCGRGAGMVRAEYRPSATGSYVASGAAYWISTTLDVLPSQIQQTLHQKLHLENGIERLAERCLLCVPYRRCRLHLDLPERIDMRWDRLSCLWIRLQCRTFPSASCPSRPRGVTTLTFSCWNICMTRFPRLKMYPRLYICERRLVSSECQSELPIPRSAAEHTRSPTQMQT